MQPSSLVFLAIIAMWAAYLLPQWVRRRDAMGQSRGRDRDSGGLRILRPRRRSTSGRSASSLLTSENAQDGSQLDAVIRPDSPQAMARRAAAGRPDAAVRRPVTRAGRTVVEGSGAGGSGAGGETAVAVEAVVAGEVTAAVRPQGREPGCDRQDEQGQGRSGGNGAGGSGAEIAATGATGVRVSAAGGLPPGAARASVAEPGVRRPARRPASASPGASAPPGPSAPPGMSGMTAVGATAVGAARAVGAAAGRASAIRRARVLAVLLSGTVLSWLAVALSLVQTVVALAVTALLIADLFALRAVARRREAVRRQQSAVPQRPATATAATAATGTDGGVDLAARVAAAGVRRPTARSSGASLRRTLPPAAARRPAAHRVGKREVEAAESGRPTSDGTWMPVPVPPPTYTLKPMAPRPEPPALNLDGDRPAGPAGPGGAAVTGAAPQGSGAGTVVVGSEGIAPPSTGPLPDRYEGVEPPAAQDRPAKRPWDDDREWADELDLDAVLARRRAVNG